MTPRERASALLDLEDGRGALKRSAAELDADPELRAAVLTLAAERRVELPADAATWPGKRLLRAARDRAGAAQEIRSPIARDEGFTCSTCGKATPPHGRTARDHCPFCLWSEHVDVVPGDRAAGCGGRLEPVAVEKRGGRYMIHYRCARCATGRVNQAVLDGDPPDDWGRVVALSARDAR